MINWSSIDAGILDVNWRSMCAPTSGAGSKATTPPIHANSNLPLRIFQDVGSKPPVHSGLSIPSAVP